MNDTVSVSVIMPTYNKSDIIRRGLVPLLEQEGLTQHYEVIVVDNNSIDDTVRVLDDFTKQYPHLRYVVEERRGAGAARNRGILESQGTLLIFVDDDIVVLPDHIVRHRAYHNRVENNLCVVALARDKAVFDSPILKQYVPVRCGTGPSEKCRYDVGIYLTSQNFSIRRDTLERVCFEGDGRVQYFDETFYRRQDGELGYRLDKAGVAFVYTKSIYCEHHHTFRRGDIVRRSYLSGYYLQRLHDKYPELKERVPTLIIRNPLVNILLLLAGYVAFGVGYPFQWVSPWLMLKGVGSRLLYHASHGYQQAMHDYRKSELYEQQN
ncbi:MAG: glycosyltransferase [Chloroflexota bacterium]|nr:glycosyltransferase [Chloroflexota bacterium]